jgi:hypothetical protein
VVVKYSIFRNFFFAYQTNPNLILHNSTTLGIFLVHKIYNIRISYAMAITVYFMLFVYIHRDIKIS